MERYSSNTTRQIWSELNRFNCMLKAEVAYLKALINLNIFNSYIANGSKDTINENRKNALKQYNNLFNYVLTSEDLIEIRAIEETTKHETLAFLSFLEQKFHTETKYLHFGLTSSDAIDTGLAIQINQMCFELETQSDNLIQVLKNKSKEYANTPIYGRSHGMHAEVTTFGLILAGHLMEVSRAKESIRLSGLNLRLGKFSGPVGNYNHCSSAVEKEACGYLYLEPAILSTQIIARDRHAKFISDCAIFAGVIERLATTIRHLQRPEINEVAEGFSIGQKGSSSMPHKKNPILCENLCGLARIVRSTVQPALEDINLWHERDMTHSSVERYIIPEATTTLCFMIERMSQVMTNLVVFPENMLQKIIDNDSYATQSVLLTLIVNGFSREEAYKVVQDASFRSKANKSKFRTEIMLDQNISFDKAILQPCFDIENLVKICSQQVYRIVK